MVRNVHVRNYNHIIISPQRYGQVFGAERELKSENVASLVYIIHDGGYNKNVCTDKILLLMVEWDVEYCMDAPLTIHMI